MSSVFRFLDLPAELRTMVYRSLVVNTETRHRGRQDGEWLRNLITRQSGRGRYEWQRSCWDLELSILRVNRQVHEEARQVFDRENHIVIFEVVGASATPSFSPDLLSRFPGWTMGVTYQGDVPLFIQARPVMVFFLDDLPDLMVELEIYVEHNEDKCLYFRANRGKISRERERTPELEKALLKPFTIMKHVQKTIFRGFRGTYPKEISLPMRSNALSAISEYNFLCMVVDHSKLEFYDGDYKSARDEFNRLLDMISTFSHHHDLQSILEWSKEGALKIARIAADVYIKHAFIDLLHREFRLASHTVQHAICIIKNEPIPDTLAEWVDSNAPDHLCHSRIFGSAKELLANRPGDEGIDPFGTNDLGARYLRYLSFRMAREENQELPDYHGQTMDAFERSFRQECERRGVSTLFDGLYRVRRQLQVARGTDDFCLRGIEYPHLDGRV